MQILRKAITPINRASLTYIGRKPPRKKGLYRACSALTHTPRAEQSLSQNRLPPHRLHVVRHQQHLRPLKGREFEASSSLVAAPSFLYYEADLCAFGCSVSAVMMEFSLRVSRIKMPSRQYDIHLKKTEDRLWLFETV